MENGTQVILHGKASVKDPFGDTRMAVRPSWSESK